MEFIVSSTANNEIDPFIVGNYIINDEIKENILVKIKELNDGTTTLIKKLGISYLAIAQLQSEMIKSIILTELCPNVFAKEVKYITNMIHSIVTYEIIKHYILIVLTPIVSAANKNRLLNKLFNKVVSAVNQIPEANIVNTVIGAGVTPTPYDQYATPIPSAQEIIDYINESINGNIFHLENSATHMGRIKITIYRTINGINMTTRIITGNLLTRQGLMIQIGPVITQLVVGRYELALRPYINGLIGGSYGNIITNVNIFIPYFIKHMVDVILNPAVVLHTDLPVGHPLKCSDTTFSTVRTMNEFIRRNITERVPRAGDQTNYNDIISRLRNIDKINTEIPVPYNPKSDAVAAAVPPPPLRTPIDGRLLFVPNTYANKVSIFRGKNKLLNSFYFDDTAEFLIEYAGPSVAVNIPFIRHDDTIANLPYADFNINTKLTKNIGVIGITKVDVKRPDLQKIDLLDNTKKNLPYDLTNNYKGKDYLQAKYASYGDLLSILKRVFISMVLDTRKEILYPQKPDKIDKKIAYTFGHKEADAFNLYDYIRKSIKKELGINQQNDADDIPNVTILTNRVIAKGIDIIVSQNIKNYLNAESTQLQVKALTNLKPITAAEFNFPIMPEVKYSVNFSELNDSFSGLLLEDDDLYANSLDIVNMELLLVEDETVDIDINEYKYSIKGEEEEKQKIYYKMDYNKLDESIIKKTGLQCIVNDVTVVKSLINKGVYVNQADIWGNLPIFYAIESKDSDMVSELLPKTNLYFKNAQNIDTLGHTIAQEISHQNILLNENTNVFTYSENYKQMMSNIFEVNEDLKKNIPKNIEIINYFPIYYLNSIWTTLLLKDKLENADDLYSLFKKYVSKDKEYEIPKTADFLFMLKSGPSISKELDDKLKTFSKTLDLDKKKDILTKKINKYDVLIRKVENGELKDNLTINMEKLNKDKAKVEKMIAQLNDTTSLINMIQPYDIAIMTTTYRTLPTPINFKIMLQNLDAPKVNKNGDVELYEMTHFLLGKLIKEYNENGDPLFRIENIHLYVSNIYSRILNNLQIDVKNMDELIKDNKFILKLQKYSKEINIIKQYLKNLCEILDQRYIGRTDVSDNQFNKNILECISYSTMIAIQNGYTLAIKKLLITHILQTSGLNKIDDHRQVIDYLMSRTIQAHQPPIVAPAVGDEIPSLLQDRLNDNSSGESITEKYVNEILNFTSDGEKNESTGYENVIAGIKQRLISNPYLTIKEDSQFIKNYDEFIVPYYRTLYTTMVEHQQKLVYNYMKFIINQYEGIKILEMIINKVSI